MTDIEKIALLEDWQKTHDDLEIAISAIETAFGCDMCESHIFDTSWKMYEKYTKALAIILSKEMGYADNKSSDVEEWLSWYAYDNQMGKKKFAAKAGSWKKAKKIDNLNMLLKVITE